MDSAGILQCVCQLWISSMNRLICTPQRQIILKQMLRMYTLYILQKRMENKRHRRKYWVRPIFTEERRLNQGVSDNLARELETVDTEKFFNYFRMSIETFEALLNLIEPLITKKVVVRTPISARTRLQVTLRYLASGDSMTSISYAFRIAHNTVSVIVCETCEAIWCCLRDKVFLQPSTRNWQNVASDFDNKCNFPHCIGAPDGKHVNIQVYI